MRMRRFAKLFVPAAVAALLLGSATPAGAAVGEVVAVPGSFATTFATPVVVVTEGGTVTLHNLDVQPHDVTHDVATDGCPNEACEPLFRTEQAIGLGESAPVLGVEDLEPDTYSFFCRAHAGMPGKLVVVAS